MTAHPSIEDAEREAARIRAEAERDAAAVVADARRRADAFADARIRRLRDLTDRLVVTAETVHRRFGEAIAVKEQLDDLVTALGAAAERAAHELDDPSAASATPPAQRAGGRAAVQVLDAGSTPPQRRAVS